MIPSPLRVYISTSWKGDLERERKTVEKLIELDLLMTPIYPREASVHDVSSDYFKIINKCDLVIVVLGSLYSRHVNNEINHAFRRKMPVLCFEKECKKEKKLEEEISRLKNNRIVIMRYKTIEELEKEVKEAIINLLCEKFKDHIKIEKLILRLISDGNIEIVKPTPLDYNYRGVVRINPFEQR